MSRPKTMRRCAAYAGTFSAFEEWAGHLDVHRHCRPCADFSEAVFKINRARYSERDQDFGALERNGEVVRLFAERIRTATELPDVLEAEKRVRAMLATARKRKTELAAVKKVRIPWDRADLAKAAQRSAGWITRHRHLFEDAKLEGEGHARWDPDRAENIIAARKGKRGNG
jgi:hypothetical protein